MKQIMLRVVLILFCLFFIDSTMGKEGQAAAGKSEYILLPQPQEIAYGVGTFKLPAGRFIYLEGAGSDNLLFVGRIIQESLAQVGPHWELTAAGGREPERIGLTLTVNPQEVPQPQGYWLAIQADKIRIVAHDRAGAFYAAQTLKQICRQERGTGGLFCLNIQDWPDYPQRGVLLDISRDKVPRMETLYRLVDLLAEWKVNQIQLYMEHTFAYRRHKEVWGKASPMTGEEIMDLDAYCREKFIELVPNQNSFAHMERWLMHKEYLPLAEREDRPSSISPAMPGSIELLGEMYEELLPHFTSRQFNVGCDETFDLGTGKSKEMCEKLGKGRVYLDFLLKIHKLVHSHDRTMQFWGDIILHHLELIGELPSGIIAMVWGYDAKHPYEKQCPKFEQAKVPFYVCPGTSSWNSIAGRTDNALANLGNAAENGLKYGAIGFLNTNWGDHGHWQSLPVCYPGFAYGAAVSWAYERNRGICLPEALDKHAYYDRAGVMGKLVCDLGSAYKKPGVLVGNSSVLFWLLIYYDKSFQEYPLAGLKIENLKKTRDYIDDVLAPLAGARMVGDDSKQVVDEITNAARLLRHACNLGIARLEAQDGQIRNIPRQIRMELAGDLEIIIKEHKHLWLLRNREGGLQDSVGRMENLLKQYQ